jgi:16S rRNA (uracil1498-N3)-methyltransferase
MPLRLFTALDYGLTPGAEFDLPETAAHHAQVRRVQPGDTLVLFDGRGSDWPAEVLSMARGARIRVRIGATSLPERDCELSPPLQLAFVMPAGDRMDYLIEKATELGATRLQPLHSERSVLRLSGERAARKREHWQALAVAACEQSGRRRVPEVLPVQEFASLLAGPAAAGDTTRWLLSPDAEQGLVQALATAPSAAPGWVLSGPEGGFTAAEAAAAVAAGWQPVCLGPRVLRADTAPLVALAAWGLRGGAAPPQ